MEPPAKRMRILQSVEVDEENPDYIGARQKQQQKFKGRLEALFEKYGNMHESMSDEIDMNTNIVVIDRGHLRRLKRQVGRKETILLDTLGLEAAGKSEEELEEEGEEEDSEDELAPAQPTRSSSEQTERDKKGQQTQSGDAGTELAPSDDHRPLVQQSNTPATSMAQFSAPQVPNTPNPTATLLQLVQFPQTPAGQQAQATFYATLTQTINQATHQAVASLFTGLLPPNVQIPLANAPLVPTTPTITNDKVAPATDPKWFFPPLSAEARNHLVAESSPLATHTVAPAVEDTVTRRHGNITVQQRNEQRPAANSACVPKDSPPMPSSTKPDHNSPARPRRRSPRVEIQIRRIGSRKRCHFTEAEDVYISKQRRIHQTSWATIKDSKSKWKEWPLSAFYDHWQQLQHQNLHLKESTGVSSGNGVQANNHSSIECVPETPTRSHHLPTPSSPEQEDSLGDVPESREVVPNDNGLSSSAQFDDNERELLSLAGTDIDEEARIPDDEGTLDLLPDEVIPSIETRDMVHEDKVKQHLLEELPMREATFTPRQPASGYVKTEHPPFSSSSSRKQRRLSSDFGVVSDSDAEDDDGLIETNSLDTRGVSFVCSTCQQPFKNAKNLTRHQANPRNTHNGVLRMSASLDLVGDDELIEAPTTPHIKRETSTPPASFLSASKTPKALPRHLEIGSSGSKSTSKVNRKTYLKQVKQSWTRGTTPAKSAAKRRSVSSLGRKWPWTGDDGSEDELAM